MPRIKNGILFAVVVLLFASNFVQAQTQDLVPPIDLHQQKAMNGTALAPFFSQRFLPLIGDVVDRAYYHEKADDWDKPTVATCQLNAPLATKANEPDEDGPACNQSTVSNRWVVSKGKKLFMMTTPSIEIQCERCLGECKEAPGCKACSHSPGQSCENLSESTSDHSMDQYCDQVAKILVTTLNGSHADPKAQQRAIHTALKMVAEKANRDANAGPEKLLVSQQQSLKQVLLEKARACEERRLADENKASLEPVYAAQYRNSQQLKSLAETDQSIIRSLMSLEKKFAGFAMMQRAKLTDSEVRTMMTSVEEMEQREQEISRLQSELETLDRRIKQLRISPVQPAAHLEPAFLPERQLRPINDKFRR